MRFSHQWMARAAVCLALLAPWLSSSAQLLAQAGTGAWSDKQTWANDTTHGGALEGFYYWPAAQPAPGSGRALVLVLHGCGQTAGGDVINGSNDAGYNWKAVAEAYGAMILAPNATGNVYGAHCWDWADTGRGRGGGHTAVLLDLVDRFVRNTDYAIDPNQVYVTGLSSGGAKAMVLGCTAPDVFAGLGLSAAPPTGVTTAQIALPPQQFDAATAADACRKLAEGAGEHFKTQVASVIWGTNDYTVAQAYGKLDAEAMRQVYGGAFTEGAETDVPGGGKDMRYRDANGKVRTSQVRVTGLGHAWPAGAGGQNANFVSASRVNYPAFLMDFWFNHNLRVAQVPAPRMATCDAAVSGAAVTVTGSASFAEGGIARYRVVLNGASPIDDGEAGSGASFSATYGGLRDGSYSGSVTAIGDNEGVSNACTLPAFRIGPPPPFSCTTSTASNYAHVQAGRAHLGGVGNFYVLANGSDQNLGLYNVFTSSTLAQTSQGYYVKGSCP